MNSILPVIVGLLTTTNLTAVIAWIFDRKKRNKEYALLAEELNIKKTDSKKLLIEIYQDAITDFKEYNDKRFFDQKKYNDERFKDLEKDLSQLKKNVNLWKEKYRGLKNEFENYKRKIEGQ